MAFRKDLSDSANAFLNLVWPIIKRWFENCEIRPVETITEIEFAKELDQYAGIDAWILNYKKGMRGLASRIQWPNREKWNQKKINSFVRKPPNSFTIRKSRASGVDTEFAKRLFAIQNDWEYPYYTVHAYVSHRSNKGRLLSVACCKTKDLILYIDEGRQSIEWAIKTVKKKGSATFYVVYWDVYREINPIKIWGNDGKYFWDDNLERKVMDLVKNDSDLNKKPLLKDFF